MRVDEFDFDLPGECIALRPAAPRDSARLLVVDAEAGQWSDGRITDLPALLEPGDLLVFNDTKVIPARLKGRRLRDDAAGPHIEATLHKRLDGHRWRAFVRPARKLRQGDRIAFSPAGNVCLADELSACVEEKVVEGEIVLRFDFSGAVLDQAIETHGEMPLPPYIASKRSPDAQDRADYQTLLARAEGAVAAPTAGLHFTEGLLDRLEASGIGRVCVTLHVGAGTFLPVKSETTEGHRMHSEWGEITPDAARRISKARAAGGRIVCVGTTALRLIETAATGAGTVEAFAGETDIFIEPGYRFRAADMLLTNFHLPRSTLFMLVCAFSGIDLMKRAYAHAVSDGYRFYSYGDACLLLGTG